MFFFLNVSPSLFSTNSCADILTSIAMGLTTLPMPKELIRWYDWSGTRLGNNQTCVAQGFFVVFNKGMFAYNLMLCVYYTCSIAFHMTEERISKQLEFWFHIIPIAFGLTMAIIPLFSQSYTATGKKKLVWLALTLKMQSNESSLNIYMSLAFT